MLNRVAARVFGRAACAVACIFALLAACGSEPPYPTDPPTDIVYPAPPEATSPEELVYFSSVVARVEFLSASAGVRIYQTEDDRRAQPAFVFRFRVVEYLKGSGDDELTVRVVALGRYDPIIYPDENEALTLMIAQSRLDERDTRWDDREAVVFLRPSHISAEAESGVYEFADRGDLSPGLYAYDIASSRNRAWLPAVASASSSSLEPRYLTGAPGAQSGGAATKSISLSEMKALVAANEEMAAKGKNVPGYADCIEEKFELDARYKRDPPDMGFAEYRIHSGQPAGYRIAGPYARAPAAYYDRLWFEGPDSDLFASRIANDPDNDPATGYAREYVALRPIPEGEYKALVNFQYSAWRPCGYYPEVALNMIEATIIAAAPDGVVHEAFFDPAALKGGAAGADLSNGVLAPTDFAFGGAGASLDSIRWQSQAVEMRLSPHTRLPNHHADFIAPDGSVALRLDFDDASETGEGASRALSWNVCAQPWRGGDLLTLRLSESPTDLIGATLDADCSASATSTAN